MRPAEVVYFDTHMDDGTQIVVVFTPKSIAAKTR